MFLTWWFLFASQLTGFRLHRCFNSVQEVGTRVQEEKDEEPACPTLIQEAELADPPVLGPVMHCTNKRYNFQCNYTFAHDAIIQTYYNTCYNTNHVVHLRFG